ncbi:MAG: hypothetical protein WBY44_21205 [Bryobacteraceae bacterium]
MNRLASTRRAQVVHCLIEGNSIRSTVRMAGVAKNTVQEPLLELGAVCSKFQNEVVRDLKCQQLQCDEIWSFVYAKEKNVRPEVTEQQVAAACGPGRPLTPNGKLIPCWLIGKRDAGCDGVHARSSFPALATA